MIERLIPTLFTIGIIGVLTVMLSTTAIANSTDKPSTVQKVQVFLKSEIKVAGDKVTLGDLFEDAGEAKDISVASAPAPGENLNLNAHQIQAVAENNNLKWSNAIRLHSVTIRRESRSITLEEILPSLSQALNKAGAPVDSDIQLSDQKIKVEVAKNAEADFEVTKLDFDHRSGFFKATLYFPTAGSSGLERHIQGRAYPVRVIPVLNRYMEAGEKVQIEDLSWEPFRVSQIGRTTLITEDALVGTETKRPLEPGRPLRKFDVRVPIMLAKDQLVTIFYKIPGLTLSVEGRALDNGGDNQTVRVLNTRSHRTVLARVIGPNEVLATTASTDIQTSAHSTQY